MESEGKHREFRSSAWEYFTPSTDRQTAKCKICEVELRTTGGTTTGLNRHLRTQHHNVKDPGSESTSASFINSLNATKKCRGSPVWDHFTPANDKQSANCKVCGKSIKTTGGSTTSLIRHLLVHNTTGQLQLGTTVLDASLEDDLAEDANDEEEIEAEMDTSEAIKGTTLQGVAGENDDDDEEEDDGGGGPGDNFRLKRRRAARSCVWEYFIPGEGRQTAKCKICKVVMKTSGGCTSGLLRHLGNVHGVEQFVDKKETREKEPEAVMINVPIPSRLLHHELQQMGQMIQNLSYELIVLRDFIKETDGDRFVQFRQKHSKSQVKKSAPQSNQSEMSTPLSKIKIESDHLLKMRTGISSSKKETRERRKDDKPHGSTSRSDSNNECGDSDNAEEMVDSFGMNETEAPADSPDISDPLGVDDSDESNYSDDLRNRKQRPGSKRKRKHDIWKKYKVSKLANGKIQAKCKKCSNTVSCKVERLRLHYDQCIKGLIKPLKRISELEDKQTVQKLIENREGTPRNADPLNRGRSADLVWGYFNVEEDANGKKTVTCKSCSVQVSGKVERVRRHFILCKALDKEHSGDSSSE